MKTIAIMQPYFLPYLAYWQLLNLVDEFILLDDVQFIKKGFIHRNFILLNEKPFRFTLPIKNNSQHQLINNLFIDKKQPSWHKLPETIRHAYHQAPQFAMLEQLLTDIFQFHEENLVNFIINSINTVCRYLQINTPILRSSTFAIAQTGVDRLITICQLRQAQCYINPIGGKQLYQPQDFMTQGIQLKFLYSDPVVTKLSILDSMMNNSQTKLQQTLMECRYE